MGINLRKINVAKILRKEWVRDAASIGLNLFKSIHKAEDAGANTDLSGQDKLKIVLGDVIPAAVTALRQDGISAELEKATKELVAAYVTWQNVFTKTAGPDVLRAGPGYSQPSDDDK